MSPQPNPTMLSFPQRERSTKLDKKEALEIASTLPPLSCGGCRKCCLGDTITLMEGDDPTLYKTKLVEGRRVLRKRKNGNCIYLGARGCTIWPKQPTMCRKFDCRTYALGVATLPEHERGVRLRHPSTREGIARLQAAGHDPVAYGLAAPPVAALDLER